MTVLAEDPGYIPSTHIAVHSYEMLVPEGVLMPSPGLHGYCTQVEYRHTCKQKPIHKYIF